MKKKKSIQPLNCCKVNEMNIIQRYKIAPNTTNEAKLNLFSPFQKNKTEQIKNITIFENDIYKVSITGYKLNQIHRDILDIANYFGDMKLDGIAKDRRPIRLFSLYDIQKHLGYSYKQNQYWVEAKFKEIKNSTIEIFDKKDGDWISFNIIDIAMYSKKQNKYSMVISELYMLFFEKEISVGYKDYLQQILKLNAQTRALVRYILTFSNSFEIDLDKAMEKIGISQKTKRTFDYNKSKILEDVEKLKELNIELVKKSNDSRKKDFKIKYNLLPLIKIYHPS